MRRCSRDVRHKRSHNLVSRSQTATSPPFLCDVIFTFLARFRSFCRSFFHHATKCGCSNASFLIFEDGSDEIDIIRVFGWSTLTKCAPDPARRSDGFGYHLSRETARIQALRLSSLTGKTQKRIPDPALKRLVQFTAQQRTGIVH